MTVQVESWTASDYGSDCIRTAHDDSLLTTLGDVDDWVDGRLHAIAHKLVATERACGAERSAAMLSQPSGFACMDTETLTLEDVRWLIELLQRRHATLRKVEALREEWYHHQNATIGEITLTSRLHSALVGSAPRER